MCFYPALEALLILLKINLMFSCHCNTAVRFASAQQSKENMRTRHDSDNLVHNFQQKVVQSLKIMVAFHNVYRHFYTFFS